MPGFRGRVTEAIERPPVSRPDKDPVHGLRQHSHLCPAGLRDETQLPVLAGRIDATFLVRRKQRAGISSVANNQAQDVLLVGRPELFDSLAVPKPHQRGALACIRDLGLGIRHRGTNPGSRGRSRRCCHGGRRLDRDSRLAGRNSLQQSIHAATHGGEVDRTVPTDRHGPDLGQIRVE